MKTIVFDSLSKWIAFRKKFRRGKIGFVPTMGALHQGHVSLVERSRFENPITVVSIFVNPTQFNDPNDLKNYPRTFKGDYELLKAAGADFLIYPKYDEIYADGYKFRVSENHLSGILCGASRPGHFEGVLTVVMKLFNLVGPTRAYFGEKDYQQFLLIKEMVDSFFMNIQVVPCPIIREENGLAMSSRNERLSAEGREKAGLFFKELSSGKELKEIRKNLEENGFKVDYIEEFFGRRLGAVFLENVRLIDNVPA
ncbi:MAG: pantoate--beta-alanine ligase [Candidatus Riflebacteria bacterium]|nr:pantoate--beta-alanine ligase [Candidatus Riflebacteria bacterium]